MKVRVKRTASWKREGGIWRPALGVGVDLIPLLALQSLLRSKRAKGEEGKRGISAAKALTWGSYRRDAWVDFFRRFYGDHQVAIFTQSHQNFTFA